MEKAYDKKITAPFFALVLVVAMGIPTLASAATLLFTPSSGSMAVGSTFPVSVYVSSPAQSINAVSGVVSFPTNVLEVTGLSKTNSIINMWAQEPSFSNANGYIAFEGVVFNPGFQGMQGTIVTVTFRVRAAGNGQILLSSGSVLANDGKGTNILNALGNARFSLENVALGIPATNVTPLPVTPLPKRTPSFQQTFSTSSSEQMNKPLFFFSDVLLSDMLWRGGGLGVWGQSGSVQFSGTPAPQKVGVSEYQPELSSFINRVTMLFSIIIPLAALIFVFLFICMHTWWYFLLLRRRLKKEANDVESTLHSSCDLLRGDVTALVATLEEVGAKRKLTTEEKIILDQLTQSLSAAGRAVEKEIAHIKKASRSR